MATSKKYLMAAAGAAGGEVSDYWINVRGGTSADYSQGIAVDSSDNIIIGGFYASDGAGGYDFLVTKYNSSGSLLWERLLGGSSNDIGRAIAVDSSDNIIITGQTLSDGAGSYDLLTAKFNSSGTLQWDRTLGGSGNDNSYAVAVDSSDNIIVGGYGTSDGAGADDIMIAKYNSSGTLQWDRTLGGTSDDRCFGITVDSSDNIIVTGFTLSDGAGGNDIIIAKYNSSGTLQWDRTLGGTGNEFGWGVAVDSSDNIVITGFTESDGAGNRDFLIAKYNSSGTIQWQRTLGGTSIDVGYDVTVDSSDNIVVCGYTQSDGAGGSDILIAKYNSSGTLQWDRTLGATATDIGYGVAVDSLDNIVITAVTAEGAGGDDVLVAKLPSDGSLEGTYGAFTYEDAVLTDSAASLTDSAASLTDAAAVLTDAAAVLSETKLYTLYTIS